MNKTIRFCVVVLIFCVALPMAAQRKKTMTYELGLNNTIISSYKGMEPRTGSLYFQMSRMIKKTPISIDFTLSINAIDVEKKRIVHIMNDDVVEERLVTYDDEPGILSFIPSVNYHFYRTKKVDAYAGVGVGGSLNIFEEDILHDELRTYVTTMPRVGILLFNHLNISFEYYAYYKRYNRGTLSLGYVF